MDQIWLSKGPKNTPFLNTAPYKIDCNCFNGLFMRVTKVGITVRQLKKKMKMRVSP